MPDGSTQYEVKTTLTLTASGGTYIHYLEATTDAKSGPSASGTFYSVELQNPTVTAGGMAGSGTLALNKRENGSMTVLASTVVPCHNGTTIRSVMTTYGIFVFVDNLYYLSSYPTPLLSGKPGIGAFATPAGNSIARVDLGGLDRVGPSAVISQSIGTSEYPDHVGFAVAGGG